MMIKAVLFDLDGVIIESIDAHVYSFLKMLKEVGINEEYGEIRKHFGWGAPILVKKIFEKHKKKLNPDVYAAIKDEYFQKKYINKVRLIPGVQKYMKKLKENKIKIAICSCTDRKNLDMIIKKFRVCADLSLARQDVKRVKPYPDIYNKAVRLFELKKEQCIIIEDSAVGIKAGKNAGVQVVAITTSTSRSELLKADRIIDSYKELMN